ncbi:DUF2972 domain-containing protein, partial [Campylobacter jejuni]|nr:DUF2972 domain-containing protein [Campylobacter jejuni]
FKKFYSIIKQYKKEKLIYQETIKVFPSLKYPNLEKCPDYKQALKYQFHLSYMLGEVLIKTFKTWYKGSIFTLVKNIKKANKEFQIFKKTFDQFKIYDVEIPEDLLSNKSLFLEKILQIEKLLKTHKDYKPIIENIFHNFDYFIKNFNLIEEWLLSNDFNEKYKKENHPYPSLLDPKKLNDEKEKINYKTIPAQLAWEMNLPLPDNYEFVFLSIFGAGNSVMKMFFHKCDIGTRFGQILDAKKEYIEMFYFLMNNSAKNVLTIPGFPIEQREKLIFMVQKNVKCLCVVRDPIGVYKTLVNHRGYMPDRKAFFYQNESFKKMFFGVRYRFYNKNAEKWISHMRPTLDSLYSSLYLSGHERMNFSTKVHLLKSITEVVYVDMSEIMPSNIFKTLKTLSKKFNFKLPESIKLFFSKPLNGGDFLYLLPKTLIIEKDFVWKRFAIACESNFEFLITQEQYLNEQVKKMINVSNIFVDSVAPYNILVYTNNDKMLKNENFLAFIKRYISVIIKKLLKVSQDEKAKLFKEEDILDYLKQNKTLCLQYRDYFDKELIDLKKHRPDIVASWKYYQEFEKMCEELDGKNEIEQIENSSN